MITALREQLDRVKLRRRAVPLHEELADIRARVAKLPVLDERAPDEILGYDDHGLPR